MAFRDRFFTPRVARAITSPSGIVLAGAGTAAGVLLGLGPLAALVGLGAWVARVAAAIPRRPAGTAIDPFAVGEPWREFLLDAQRAQRRFQQTVDRCRPGPMRDRMQTVASRITDALGECWRIARQGDQLDAARRGLDVRTIRAELEEVLEERRRLADDTEADAALYRTQQAIESQLAAEERLGGIARDAQNRLRLLNAQLDEAVARAVELSLEAGDVSQLGSLTDEVENVVGELAALRSALEETAGARGVPRATGGTAAAGTS